MRHPLLIPALLCLVVSIQGQAPPQVQASHLGNHPVIDGSVDAEEWKEATKLDGFVDAFVNRAPEDLTDVYLGYDSEAIYVAFYAHDTNPESIVGREVTPGAEFNGEDTVTFRINPFGTRSWDGMSRFQVNVLNTQSESISGGRSSKREWRGEWQSATKRQPDGWTCEMRIPWKVLNYPAGRSLTMNIQFERYQARTRVGSMWANAGTNNQAEFFGSWTAVEPPIRRKPIQFLAYAAPEFESSDDGPAVFGLRSGIDIRSSFTNTLTGLLSIAPDFRNIESQIAGIGFTRTERYLDESRPFFTEGSGFFGLTGEFTFGRMFYSRRIENFDVGGKVYGKVSPNLSVGGLATYQGGESASVFHLAQSFGPKANANVYATSFDTEGVQNQAVGGGAWGKRGSFGADFQVAAEHDRHRSTNTAGAASISYEVPKWFAILRYQEVDPAFDPALAYIPWKDRKGAYLYANYFTEYRSGPLRDLNADLFVTDYDDFDGNEQQVGADPSLSLTLKNDIRLGLNIQNTRYFGDLDHLYGLSATFNSSNRFKRYGFYLESGTRGGDPSSFQSAFASFRAFRKLDLGLNFAHQSYQGSDSQVILTTAYEISPTKSVSARLVQNDGGTNAYFAYRSAGMAGTELFVIIGDPNAAETTPRISVKVVWAF